MSRRRHAELRSILEARRDEIERDLGLHRRSVREVSGQLNGQFGVLDNIEAVELCTQEDFELILAEMRSETLALIKDTLERLEQDDYGNCRNCGEEIAEKRLRALPFAVRCKGCEEARENAESVSRQVAVRRGLVGGLPFFDE